MQNLIAAVCVPWRVTEPRPDGEQPVEAAEGTPRWVFVLAIAAAVLLLVLVILHLSGVELGGHGP
jgi:hypothetical protein